MSAADVQSLIQLLDGSVSEAAARGALARASGNIGLAVSILFEGLGGCPGAPASAVVLDADGSDADASPRPAAHSQPPALQRAVTSVVPKAVAARRGRVNPWLADVPEPSAKRPRPRASASPPASSAPASPPAAAAAAPPAGAAPAASAAPQRTPPAAGLGASKPPPFSLSSRPVQSPSSRPVQPPSDGWERAEQDSWMSFSPSSPCIWPFDFPDQFCEWQRQVLETDPPSVSLSGPQLETLPEVSDGRMHGMDRAPGSGMEICLDADIKHEHNTFAVKTSRLMDLFRDILSSVRYPPTEHLEFSWRVLPVDPHSGQRLRVVPDDLRGPLPERPFRLLDNRSDTAAAQPPSFGEQRLRPEQLRSLAWMLAREGVSRGDEVEEEETEPFVVEWRRYYNPDGLDAGDPSLDQLVVGAPVRLKPSGASRVWTATGVGKVPIAALPETNGVVTKAPDAQGRAFVAFSSDGQNLSLSCLAEDLMYLGAGAGGSIRPGCRIRVAPHVLTPTFGWGGVTKGMVGVVQKVDANGTVVARFPVHQCWKAQAAELEAVDAVGCHEDGRPLCVLDLRIRACYRVRGGILADKVGYGKTATTIALIDSTLGRPAPELPLCDRGCFIPARGTLIVVPSNLFEQWLSEIGKFLWGGKNLRGSFQKGWSPKGGPLRIFAMSNVTPLTKVKARELAEADVVVCSYRLLFSPIYQERRAELGGSQFLHSLVDRTRELLKGTVSVRSGRKGDSFVQSWQDLEFPVLEQFYWRRVVFDEFHELESFDSTQQNSLQHLRASFRWGLTGTPPVESSAGVIFMSSLFRLDLPGYLSSMPRSGVDLSTWEGDRLLTESAGRFLDEFARQNTAELPHIRLEEHVIAVRHTMAERALYLGQAHEAPDLSDPNAFQTDVGVQALERLLKLCSHFQANGDHVASAKEECVRIGEQKERRVVKARYQVQRCCRAQLLLEALLLRSRPPGSARSGRAWRAELASAEQRFAKEGDAGARTVQFATRAAAEAGLETAKQRLEVLDGHRPRDEVLARCLGLASDGKRGYAEQWTKLQEGPLSAQELEELLEGQAQEQAANLQELLEASSSMEFFSRTVSTLARGDQREARNCSICFGEDLPLSQLAITPCAHTFCLPCLQAVVGKLGRCSLCNQPLTQKDVRPLAQEIPFVEAADKKDAAASSSPAMPAQSSSSSSAAAPLPAQSAAGDAPPGDCGKYGTKLATVVSKLQQLRREDPSAKVILFVQFDDLKRKVAGVLAEFGIPVVQLHGAVSQRSAVIRDWQHNPASEAFVLLLSLAQSASGTNLTAASHVVFLHPMLASTPEKAVAHELQAIGRARRHGQRKDVVHVWRFVTVDTVEQALTERHQSELWARERAKELSGGGGAAPASEGP